MFPLSVLIQYSCESTTFKCRHFVFSKDLIEIHFENVVPTTCQMMFDVPGYSSEQKSLCPMDAYFVKGYRQNVNVLVQC